MQFVNIPRHVLRTMCDVMLLVIFLLGVMMAHAFAIPPGQQERLTGISDELVLSLSDLARELLPRAALPDGTLVGEETVDEKALPILSMPEKQMVVDRAIISVYAEWCELDWKGRNFVPFMEKMRADTRRDEKQLAYIGILHGVTMGMFEKSLAEMGKCTRDMQWKINKKMIQPVDLPKPGK